MAEILIFRQEGTGLVYPHPRRSPGRYHESVKLLIFSDIHADARALDRLMSTEADYYFCAGDLINWGRNIDAMGEILKRRGDRVYVIPGNHETASQIADLCTRFGLHDFHGGQLELGGFHVVGLGYSSPTPFDTPGEYSEAELARRLAPFAPLHPLALVCHAPPYDTALDQIRPGLHGGSTAVRDFIDARQPEYFFCGHIH